MEPDKQPQKPNIWWAPALEMFSQLAGWLVFPILVGVFLGKWLDGRFGTGQRLYFLCVAVSFIVTMAGLIRYSVKAMKKMDLLSKKDEKEKEKNKTEQK